MCLGPGQQLLVPPTERATKYAQMFKIVLGCQGVLLIAGLITTVDFSKAMWNLMGLVIGWCAIRNPDGFAFQQLFCYIFLFGIQFVTSIVDVSLWAGGNDKTVPPPGKTSTLEQWQRDMYHVILVVQPIVYAAGLRIAYVIYEELRTSFNEGNNVFDAGGGGMGGGPGGAVAYGGRAQQPQPAAATETGGFKPFSGKGYRLSG